MITHVKRITSIAKINQKLQCKSQVCVIIVMRTCLLKEL